MQGLFIKTVSLAAVVCMLAGYNAVLKNREKEDEFAKLCVQVAALEEFIQSSQETQEIESAGVYTDGEWDGEAQGFGGSITVKVKVEKGRLTEIELLSAKKEDAAYLSMAKEIIPAMLQKQSADVDTITGATVSSAGIKNAVAQALEKAET